MNKLIKIIKQYFPTMFASLLLLIAICFVVQLELLYRTEKKVTYDSLNIENLSKFCTIEELEKQLLKNPDDYILNIRLGQMYESLGKLDVANDFYKTALKLSGRSNLALYSYAIFCAKNDMYVFAATLAEELDSNSKRTNYFKAKIYEQIADTLDKKNNLSASVKSYQVVYKYAKSIGDKKYFNSIAEKYANEYIKLADYNMSINEYEEAISNLKNSINIKNSALANYKLGLIYLNNNNELAEKHINKAFYDDYYIVNPYIYNSVLTKLIEEAKILGNNGVLNYYDLRLKRFKKVLSEVYLYKNQIVIDNSALITKKTFFNKLKHMLYFDLKNNTDKDLNNLFVKAELYINGQKQVVTKKIITPTNSLELYSDFVSFGIDLPNDIQFNNLKQNNDIFVRYFAKRAKDAPWILIKIDFLNI